MDRALEFLTNHWALSLAFVLTFTLLLLTELRRRAGGATQLSPMDAVRLINQQDAVLLDVRDDGEFKAGHIANALHIPVGLLDKEIQQLDEHKAKPIILYCRSGVRSTNAALTLRKHGLANIYTLHGGFLAWQAANLPVKK